MDNLFKRVMHATLGLAVVTTERVQEWVEELVERGREYQEDREIRREEAEYARREEMENEEEEAESVKDFSEEFKARREELEQRIRGLVDRAVESFNFIKNDDHDRVEKRITKLEERLSKLAKQVTDEKTKEDAERI